MPTEAPHLLSRAQLLHKDTLALHATFTNLLETLRIFTASLSQHIEYSLSQGIPSPYPSPTLTREWGNLVTVSLHASIVMEDLKARLEVLCDAIDAAPDGDAGRLRGEGRGNLVGNLSVVGELWREVKRDLAWGRIVLAEWEVLVKGTGK